MANLKISELDAGTTPLIGDELVAIVQGGATVRVPSSALKGLQGDAGEDGREVELQKGTTHIQWRYVGDLDWIDLVALADITGPSGTGGAPQWDDIEGKPELVLDDDSRLSDARTPTGGAGGVLSGTYPNPGFSVDMATQGELDTQITLVYAALDDLDAAKIDATEKGAANGVATLGADSKILVAQLPAIAITDTFPVANEAAMLALTAEKGDIAVRSDLNKTFALAAEPASTLGNWLELKTPTDAVLSVAGRTGAVTLTSTDVGLSNVDNTADSAKPVSTAQQAALDAKEPSLAAGGATTQYLRGDKAWTDFSTSVRAALLTGFTSGPNSAVAATDSVLAAIQKLQAQISAGGGGGATIKAIQRGTIAIANGTSTASATISPVEIAKTELRFLGGSGVTSAPTPYVPRISLTNSTTITASMGGGTSGATTISWELTEWN